MSYTWNALLSHWVEWRVIVEEFLAPIDAMRVDGDIESMVTFVTEALVCNCLERGCPQPQRGDSPR